MGVRRQASGGAVLEPGIPVQLAETLERVRALVNWGAGWEDYDAPPPSSVQIERASHWVSQLFTDAQSVSGHWIDPLVTANEDGEILFEWWRDPRKLAVYVTDHGAEYIKVWGPNVSTEMEEGSARTSSARREIWSWFMSAR